MSLITAQSIALPIYANTEEAFTDIVGPTSHPTPTIFTYISTGAYVDVPITMIFTVATSAVVATRSTVAFFQNQDGLVIWSVPFALGQPASTSASYSSAINGTSIVGADGTSAFAPMPPAAMIAGYRISLGVNNAQAGDVATSFSVQLVRFPAMSQEADRVVHPLTTLVV